MTGHTALVTLLIVGLSACSAEGPSPTDPAGGGSTRDEETVLDVDGAWRLKEVSRPSSAARDVSWERAATDHDLILTLDPEAPDMAVFTDGCGTRAGWYRLEGTTLHITESPRTEQTEIRLCAWTSQVTEPPDIATYLTRDSLHVERGTDGEGQTLTVTDGTTITVWEALDPGSASK